MGFRTLDFTNALASDTTIVAPIRHNTQAINLFIVVSVGLYQTIERGSGEARGFFVFAA